MTKTQIPSNELETMLTRRGKQRIAGLDEVGRGPLAGPVVAASVVLDPNNTPQGLNDSKKLSAEVREELFAKLLRTADIGVAAVPSSIIDVINIRQASLLAMQRSLFALRQPADHALVDGNDIPQGLPCDADYVIKGDSKSLSIAAASIVAKVVRDRMMVHIGGIYPGYAFESHKGYATQAHRDAIDASGPTSVHRMSFSPFVQGSFDFE